MRVGAVFPQTEIGTDPVVIRDYALRAEELGYDHLLAYEHLLGSAPPEDWDGAWPYGLESPFHEPLVLFGHLAAVTTLELGTAVLILPQRPAALVAKQVATLSLLAGGRIRLGVGVGWNPVEHEALGVGFASRGGERVEEQIEIIRRLWSEETVTLDSQWHRLAGVGIRPRPPSSIPIWIGGSSRIALRRAARLGDGWLATSFADPAAAAESLDYLRGELRSQGRDADSFEVEFRIPFGEGDPDEWRRLADGWRGAGATHVSLNTMDLGWSPRRHLDALEQFAAALELP